MDIAAMDLNLLVVLEALLEKRSVTKASNQVGLSQSALSSALGRLRITFRGAGVTLRRGSPAILRRRKRLVLKLTVRGFPGSDIVSPSG
jgi:regulatory helix-turn-helix LysR family protein